MATLHSRDRDVSDFRDRQQDDREISLGTGTILGIFFALALLCAVFFGFGYSMGRKSAQPSSATVSPAAPSSIGSMFSSFKPSAGSPSRSGNQAAPASATKSDSPASEDTTGSPRDPDGEIVTTSVTKEAASSEEPHDRPRPVQPSPRTPSPASEDGIPLVVRQPSTSAVAAPVAMPAVNPNGTTMVQIAAVSHQEDADVLLSALKKRGYAVFIRQEPQDHLLHVQVGPFSTRKDADAMRQRLLADGYNAIVK